MLNLYEEIRSKDRYNKIEADGLLFAEYTCPIDEKNLGIWTHTDYLVHVISGRKIWHTASGTWTAEAGQTIYFKKGGAVVEQFFDEDFCLLLFFIPDNFIKETLTEFPEKGKFNYSSPGNETPAIRVNHDAALTVFFQSMLAYFARVENPSKEIIKLKLKELILSILVSRDNSELASYFNQAASHTNPSLAKIMEANFMYNLSLENFAELCSRSLSSFKRDFQKYFNESPGRWLLKRRLEYSAVLLRDEELSISQVSLEAGFEDLSHFCKSFKNRYGKSPGHFRENLTAKDPV